jgi:glycosyltransferase involved in cell wall biosynthesis
MIKSLGKIKRIRPDIKILIEIPTYPYDNEIKFSLLDSMLILKDRWNRRKLHKFVDCVLTYSKDRSIFQIPAMQLSNAVDSNSIMAKDITEPGDKINLIAVARFVLWHGYDRFLNGLKEYYSSDKVDKKDIVLHLVGDGPEIDRYRSLVDEFQLKDHVLFHGRKVGKELDDIYNKCEIGLDAMGRHRSNVYFNSTLKGKEYGAKGLPIISGVETEFDSDKAFRYYMRVPADESNVDIDEVINFYNNIYCSGESKENVVKSIRDYTRNNFDVSVAWKKVADYIKDGKVNQEPNE